MRTRLLFGGDDSLLGVAALRTRVGDRWEGPLLSRRSLEDERPLEKRPPELLRLRPLLELLFLSLERSVRWRSSRLAVQQMGLPESDKWKCPILPQ